MKTSAIFFVIFFTILAADVSADDDETLRPVFVEVPGYAKLVMGNAGKSQNILKFSTSFISFCL